MTSASSFLALAEIMEIHQYQIENFGGGTGLRDLAMLQPAIAMPRTTFDGQFLHPTVYEMAAVYLYHLVENHPFVDGNKRVGAMAAIIFLDLNGIEFIAANEDLTHMVLQVAQGKILKAEIALFLKNNSTLRGSDISTAFQTAA